jgi:hypothetical protein
MSDTEIKSTEQPTTLIACPTCGHAINGGAIIKKAKNYGIKKEDRKTHFNDKFEISHDGVLVGRYATLYDCLPDLHKFYPFIKYSSVKNLSGNVLKRRPKKYSKLTIKKLEQA